MVHPVSSCLGKREGVVTADGVRLAVIDEVGKENRARFAETFVGTLIQDSISVRVVVCECIMEMDSFIRVQLWVTMAGRIGGQKYVGVVMLTLGVVVIKPWS